MYDKSIKHKGLKKYWTTDNSNLLPKDMVQKIQFILHLLDNLDAFPDSIAVFKNLKLHRLSGERKDTWSLTVKTNWRITFTVNGLEIENVNLEDYH